MRNVLIIGALFAFAPAPSDLSTPLPHVRSGVATVQYQNPPRVVLDLRSPSGHLDRIPLTYDKTGQQRRGAIFEAKLVHESPKRFLIFTDRFVSNADVQGQCGASDANDAGERILHLVSLAPPAHEAASVILDSCWLGISAAKVTPMYDAHSRTLIIQVVNSSGKEVMTKLHLDENGRVLNQE